MIQRYKEMVFILIALVCIVLIIWLGVLLCDRYYKAISRYKAQSESVYVVGKCYIADNDDPFAEPLYMKVVDKKNGYVKYLLDGKYPASASERYLKGVYKEVDCKNLSRRRENAK